MRWLIQGIWCGVLLAGPCLGEEPGVKTESALVTAWADKLSAAFMKGGDRVMVFEATKPGSPAMRFQVAECQSRQFAAVQRSLGGKVVQAFGWFRAGGDADAPSCVHIWAGGEGVVRLEGIDRFIDQLEELEKLMGGDGVVGGDALDWGFYLTPESINYSMGAGLGSATRRAPWLKEDLLSGATDVEVGEEEVVFVFPNEGKLVVRTDGMLVSHALPARGLQRVLRLVSEDKMAQWSVETYFRKIDPATVRVEQVDGGAQIVGLMQQFFLGMVRMLAEVEDLGAKLDQREAEVLDRMITMYRPIARRAMVGNPKLAKVQGGLEAELRKGWVDFRKTFPEKTREVTYRQFLEMVRKPFLEKLASTPMPGLDAILPPVLNPKVRAKLNAEELVAADRIRALGGEALTRAMMWELFDAAIQRELRAELE